MLYMVVEQYKHGARPVYERASVHGRMLPTGLRYLDSWVADDEKLETCFQLMETDDPELFQEWRKRWEDLVAFDVKPVINSAQAAARSRTASSRMTLLQRAGAQPPASTAWELDHPGVERPIQLR